MPVAQGVAWESLIEFKETKPLTAPAPLARHLAAEGRDGCGAVATASVFGLMALGVIIYVVTDKGQIKIFVEGPNADVKVDGQKVRIEGLGEPISLRAGRHELTVKWGSGEFETRKFVVKCGDNKALSVEYKPKASVRPADQVGITVAPKGNGVSVKKGETVVPGEKVKLGMEDGKGISAFLEPEDGVGPKENDTEMSPAPAPQAETRPIDGKKVRPRNAIVDYYARGLAGEWQPLRDNRGQVITGGAPALSSDDLELVFWKSHPEDKGGFDIYIARRDSVDKPFGQSVYQQRASTSGQDYEPAFGGDDLALYMRVALKSPLVNGETPHQIFRAVRKKRGSDFRELKTLRTYPPVSLGGTRFSPDGRFSFYVPVGGSTYYRAEWNSKRRSFEPAETNLPGLARIIPMSHV